MNKKYRFFPYILIANLIFVTKKAIYSILETNRVKEVVYMAKPAKKYSNLSKSEINFMI